MTNLKINKKTLITALVILLAVAGIVAAIIAGVISSRNKRPEVRMALATEKLVEDILSKDIFSPIDFFDDYGSIGFSSYSPVLTAQETTVNGTLYLETEAKEYMLDLSVTRPIRLGGNGNWQGTIFSSTTKNYSFYSSDNRYYATQSDDLKNCFGGDRDEVWTDLSNSNVPSYVYENLGDMVSAAEFDRYNDIISGGLVHSFAEDTKELWDDVKGEISDLLMSYASFSVTSYGSFDQLNMTIGDPQAFSNELWSILSSGYYSEYFNKYEPLFRALLPDAFGEDSVHTVVLEWVSSLCDYLYDKRSVNLSYEVTENNSIMNASLIITHYFGEEDIYSFSFGEETVNNFKECLITLGDDNFVIERTTTFSILSGAGGCRYEFYHNGREFFNIKSTGENSGTVEANYYPQDSSISYRVSAYYYISDERVSLSDIILSDVDASGVDFPSDVRYTLHFNNDSNMPRPQRRSNVLSLKELSVSELDLFFDRENAGDSGNGDLNGGDGGSVLSGSYTSVDGNISIRFFPTAIIVTVGDESYYGSYTESDGIIVFDVPFPDEFVFGSGVQYELVRSVDGIIINGILFTKN